MAELASARDRLVELVRCSCSVGEAEDDFDEWVLWLDMWARAPRDPDVAPRPARGPDLAKPAW